MKSNQDTLTVCIIAGTARLLMVSGLIIDSLLSRQLAREFDRNRLAKALTLVTSTEQDQGEVEFDLDEEVMPEFKPADWAEYFRLWLRDGDMLSKSSSLQTLDLQRPDPMAVDSAR